MSEDCKKPGAEINEAALEGVSGGVNLPEDPIGRAAQICVRCPKRFRGKCTGGAIELADYMREHGLIEGYGACPF